MCGHDIFLKDSHIKVDISQSPLPPPKHPRHKPQGNEPAFDLRTHLYRMSGVDFTRVNGLGVLTVEIILSKVGLDPSRFPTVQHFTSWLGAMSLAAALLVAKLKVLRLVR